MRPLRGNASDAATIHALKSDDGIHEVNASDISLAASAALLTTTDTIEQWLEAMQRQINILTGTTPVTVKQLAALWQEQPGQERDQTVTTYQPDAQQGAGTQLLP